VIVLYIAIAVAALVAAYWLFPNGVTRLILLAGRLLARTREREVVAGGLTWPYLEGGPPDGQTILLVHGFGADKDSWLLYARPLTRDYRVVVPDLPGFGDASRDPDLDYSARAQVGRLHAFADALGLERFHLAGISMGGYISALYALDYPDQVSSLVLFDNAGIDIDATSELKEHVDKGRNPLTVRTKQELEEMIELVTHRPLWIPAAFKRFFLQRSQQDADLQDRIFWGLVEELEQNALNERLGNLKMPTLIVWGRHDKLFPASIVDIMQAAIPESRSVILEETGHAPTIERPHETAMHHLEFLGAPGGGAK
jgi:pimeloyl-ACP methyl ester carboxylesterase